MTVALAAGCGAPGTSRPPTLPAPLPPPGSTETTSLTLVSVSPGAGWPFYYTQVLGTGFKPGLRLTFDGIDAWVGPVSSGIIVTNPPWRNAGTVDVKVTNPDGTSVTLEKGFTYRAATLELSKAVAVAGETVTVTWSGPHDPSDFSPPDVIGVYAIDDPRNTALWLTTSGVGDRFSAQFTAPVVPGNYEVRYHMLSRYLLAQVPFTVR